MMIMLGEATTCFNELIFFLGKVTKSINDRAVFQILKLRSQSLSKYSLPHSYSINDITHDPLHK